MDPNRKTVVCAITKDKELLMIHDYNEIIDNYSLELPICESEKEFNQFMTEAGFTCMEYSDFAFGWNTVDDSNELLKYRLAQGYLEKELIYDDTKTDKSGRVERQVVTIQLDSWRKKLPEAAKYLSNAKTIAGVAFVINEIRHNKGLF